MPTPPPMPATLRLDRSPANPPSSVESGDIQMTTSPHPMIRDIPYFFLFCRGPSPDQSAPTEGATLEFLRPNT